MAKQKHLKKPKYPPLSLLDKSIYIIFIVIVIAFVLFFMIGGEIIISDLGLRDPNVMAASARATSLLSLPFFFFHIVTIVILFCELTYIKKPIFGNAKIQYESSTWKRTYPLFDKRYIGKKPWKNRMKPYIFLFTIWLVLALLVLVIAIFSLFGRVSLMKDGGVTVYNIWNREKESYSVTEITELSLDTAYRSNGTAIKGWYVPTSYRWYAFCQLTMNDGKSYRFSTKDFRSRQEFLEGLETMKILVGKDKISIEGKDSLEKVIEDGNYSPDDTELLYELFE